jgi:hypothetical protein
MELRISLVLSKIFEHSGDDLMKHTKRSEVELSKSVFMQH